MNIGVRIRQERLRQGLTQKQLAETSLISNSYLSDIETGKTNPSINTLNRISDALEVECTVFLNKEDPP